MLDLHGARAGEGAAPILGFVHGGGFRRGQKSGAGTPFHDNVMRFAVGEGMLGVNINYRLAPEFQWPSGIEDLSGVLEWIRTNAKSYGGDPDKIFLWGHSAGAAHIADFIASRVRRGEATGLAGAILASGFYELGEEVSPWEIYYGRDVARYAERSALEPLARAEVPLFINDAELDPPLFQSAARDLILARKAAGMTFQYLRLAAHSHLSEIFAVGTADRSLSAPVRDFIAANL